jgi:hypothetical protein
MKAQPKVVRKRMWGVFWGGEFLSVRSEKEFAENKRIEILRQFSADRVEVRPVIVEWREKP